MSVSNCTLFSRKYRFILINIVIAAILSLFLVKNVVSGCRIEGNSMCPTLQTGDKLLISHIGDDPKEIKRFDIVVFKRQGNATLVKRVIALPGEKIKLARDKIFIDNRRITPPPYLKGDLLNETDDELTVPSDSFFLMGDNRGHSYDSRNFGPVHKSTIVGKAMLRYWPPDKIGKVK